MSIDALMRREREQVYRSANRLFFALLLFQSIGIIVLAFLVTPRTWIGQQSSVHIHVYTAVFLAPLLAVAPLWLIRTRPTARVTRLTVAMAQAMFSTLLIHITGGRIESHFHIFGSLAFLAFYRDAWMLLLAASIVTLDHALRGYFAPESIFGSALVSPWRWVEHGAWVVFECVFLLETLRRAEREMLSRANLLHQTMSDRDAAARLVKQQQLALDEGACVTVMDARGVVVHANENFCGLVSLPVESVIGMSHVDLFGEDDPSGVGVWQEIFAGRIWRGEARLTVRDEKPVWVNSTVVPVTDDRGTIERYIRFDIDITNEKARELELMQAREHAEAAARAKSEFLANMSHEIRTPMTAIIGFADLLMSEDRLDNVPDHRNAIRRIRANGDHLLSIINDILDVSKIEAGMMTVEEIDVSLVRFVDDITDTVEPLAEEKGLTFELVYANKVPGIVRTDPLRLKQILINLVNNAVKFTERGGITLTVEYLGSENGDDRLLFMCTDTGIGMNSEQAQNVCNAFSQADFSTTRKYGGTGLGLRISRAYSEMLGGALQFTSTPGEGSTFRAMIGIGDCRLARFVEPRDVRLEEAAPEASVTGDDCAAILAGTRVLLVEDGLDNQRLITTFLRKANVIVEVAENGAEAIEVYECSASESCPYDVILMDMQMPTMDGYTAAGILRERGWSTPIVALTAHAMPGDREKCLEAGCDDYMTKPITRDRLLRMLVRWVNAPGGLRRAG